MRPLQPCNNGPQFKIHGGTTKEDQEPLCSSCRMGVSVQGRAVGEQLRYCSALERMMPMHVTKCSSYDDKRVPSRWDMEQIAWVLSTTQSGANRKIGFISPQERRRREDAGEQV